MKTQKTAVKVAFLGTFSCLVLVIGTFKSFNFNNAQRVGPVTGLGTKVARTNNVPKYFHNNLEEQLVVNRKLLTSEQYGTTYGDEPGVDCKQYHDIPNITNEEICMFVNTTDSCQIDEGFINYIVVVYCQFSAVVPLGIAVFFIWWLFLFIGLASTADDFFCPSLEVISKTLKLSHNIAGVTFLAFGNGAPDIFSAIAAIGNAKGNDAGLAVGALFGAGIFVTTVVVGAISVTMPFHVMQRPFLRDIVFYLAAVFWTFYVLYDQKISTGEAVGFICLYIGYVLVVIIGRVIRQRHLIREKFNEEVPETTTIPVDDDDAPLINVADDDQAPLTGVDGDAPLLNIQNDSHLRVPGSNGTIQTVNQVTPPASRPMTPTTSERSVKNFAHIAENLTVSAILGHDVEEQPTLQPQRSQQEDYESDSDDAPAPPFVEFLWAICPIDTEGWSDMKVIWKIYEIFKAPVMLFLKLTIPVVDYSADNHNWCKLLNCLHIITGPVFSVMAIRKGGIMINGQFPVVGVVLLFCAVLAAVVFFTSKQDAQPVYHWAFAYLGFVVSVIWIYSIANEIVNILQMFGVIFSISDGILGLTLLAWGNSIGDLIADTVMAKQGFPRMGVSACFGGPLFNLLLGIGIPFTIACVERGGVFELKFTLLQGVLALFLTLSLLSSLIIVPLRKFYMSKGYGFYLVVLYFTFIAFAILTETEVLKIPGIDNN